MSFFLKKIYAACNHAIVLTEYGRSDPEASGIENISVIPNAREDEFRPEWKKELSNDDPIKILNVGLLCPDKGTPQLLEAFAKVHARYPKTILKLVGAPMAGLSNEAISKTAQQLDIADAIQVTGVLGGEELQHAYAEANVFVFATIAPFESFGNVLSEAMMWALPIVSTDWRGNSQVLGENHGGELAETGTELSSNLAAAIEKVIEQRSRRTEFGEINRRRFLDHYQIEKLEPELELEKLFKS
ncbi:MAG: glycosyltransferase family 4 protein [Verrucomicrobiales bacterium]